MSAPNPSARYYWGLEQDLKISNIVASQKLRHSNAYDLCLWFIKKFSQEQIFCFEPLQH
jgi:hypothetical protein